MQTMRKNGTGGLTGDDGDEHEQDEGAEERGELRGRRVHPMAPRGVGRSPTGR